MKVWFVTVGEPAPIDGENPRLLRNGILANYLLERGHEVLWWNSTFDHTHKKHRFNCDTNVKVANNYTIRFLHATGYQKNISPKRLLDHFILGLKFGQQAPDYPKPDVMLCSMPPVFLSFRAVQYAKKNGIPILLDLRDKWPEIFAEAFPEKYRYLASPFLYPLKKMLSYSCKNATALTGMTENFVQWGCKYADREPTTLDKSFPFGYKSTPPDDLTQTQAFNFWSKLGIVKDESIFTICFFGAMAGQVVFEPLCDAFKKINDLGIKARLLFCGDGPLLKDFQAKAAHLPNIIFPGWVNGAQIWALMQMSDAGLVPLKDSPNFRPNISNKPIEYMSAGLPILCSVHGVLKDILLKNNMGMVYRNDMPEEFVEAVKILSQNQPLREEMKKNTLAVFKENFREEVIYNNLADHLEQLSQKKI